MPFQPFPILDMKTGKYLRRDPWLSPQDAFETLRDCRIKRGVLEKRRGYSLYGQISKTTTDTEVTTASTNPVMGIFNYLSAGNTENLMAGDKERINEWDSGTSAFVDITRNKIRFNSTNQNWTPSVGSVIKGASSGATATVDTGGVIVDYGTIAGGTAFGTIVFGNGTVTGTFTTGEDLQNNANAAEIVGQAIAANSDEAFTGDNTNFFWTANWDHDGVSATLYIANNKDPIQLFDGTNLRQLSIDIGTDAARAGVNNVNSCRLVVIFKERVIIFSTNENGTDHFQRARYSTIKDPQSWPTSNFKDAPTFDVITSARFIGDELYVWLETSVWRFTWTGDSDNPFEWERVSSNEGAVAQMSLVTHEDRQFAIGAARIQMSDGRDVVAADAIIPDFVLEWNQESLSYSNSLLIDEEKHILMSYASDAAASDDADQPDDGNVYPDSAVVLNYEDQNFATYSLPIHTLGTSRVEDDLTWDIDDAWEDIDFAWNAGQGTAGFPIALMGNHVGKIMQLNSAGSDDTATIPFEALSSRWNPYTEKGHKAKLGYILFLVDVDVSASFDVASFVNTDNTPFQTKSITCTAVRGSEDKAWHRVDVFATADFHRIKISNNASSNRPRIHAIVPHFQDVGGRLN